MPDQQKEAPSSSIAILKKIYHQLADPTDPDLVRHRRPHSTCPHHSNCRYYGRRRKDRRASTSTSTSTPTPSPDVDLYVEPLRLPVRPNKKSACRPDEAAVKPPSSSEPSTPQTSSSLMDELLALVNAEIATRKEWRRSAREAAERGARRLKNATLRMKSAR